MLLPSRATCSFPLSPVSDPPSPISVSHLPWTGCSTLQSCSYRHCALVLTVSYSAHAQLQPPDLAPWPASSLRQGNKVGIYPTSETKLPWCWIFLVPFSDAPHQLCRNEGGRTKPFWKYESPWQESSSNVFCFCKIKSPSSTEGSCFYETTCVFRNVFKEHSCWYLFRARVTRDSGQFDYYFFFSRLFTEAFSWGIFTTAGWPFVWE